MTAEEILSQFYDVVVFALGDAGWTTRFDPERLRGVKRSGDLKDARTGEVVVKLGTKITPRILERMREQGIEEQLVDEEELYGRYIAEDIVDPENGEIHAEAGEEITKDLLERLGEVGAKSTPTLAIRHLNHRPITPTPT